MYLIEAKVMRLLCMNKICIVLAFFCMQIAGMGGITDDSKALIFDYADFESKNYLALTSKQFLTFYKPFLERLTLNEYIDGLYLFSSSENKLAAWVGVNKKDMYQVPLINYKILKSLGNSFFNEDVGRAFYLAEKKFCMQTETTILHSIKEAIRDNKKTELKFCIHRHDTKVAITLFSQNYVEERHKHVLNNICSFFDQESSLKNFKAIENKINNKKPAINEVIINKALKHNNFSVLVFLLHKFYSEIYQVGIHVIADMIGVGSILDTAIDDNKKLLIQAGYEVESLIRLLKQAASDN